MNISKELADYRIASGTYFQRHSNFLRVINHIGEDGGAIFGRLVQAMEYHKNAMRTLLVSNNHTNEESKYYDHVEISRKMESKYTNLVLLLEQCSHDVNKKKATDLISYIENMYSYIDIELQIARGDTIVLARDA